MGKWILYALILLNLIAFLWFYSNSEDDLEQPKQQTNLLLNSEKISIVKADVESKAEQNVALPSSSQQQQTPLKQDEIEVDPLQAIIGQQASGQSSTENSAPKQKDQPKLVEEPDVKKLTDSSVSTTPDKVNKFEGETEKVDSVKLQTQEEQALLEEMASFANTAVEETVQTTALPMLCYQYGPLNQNQAEIITEVMKQQLIPVVQQSRVLVEPRGFLVLIMPQKNSNGAKSEMRAARKAGLDAFTITKGEWNNGVSLGIFSAKENADKLFKRAKGLIPKSKVSIKKRIRESEVYRILFKLKNEQDPAVLLANKPFPSFNSKNPLQKTTKIAKKSCETVEF